jgi:hypothetical protein
MADPNSGSSSLGRHTLGRLCSTDGRKRRVELNELTDNLAASNSPFNHCPSTMIYSSYAYSGTLFPGVIIAPARVDERGQTSGQDAK